MSFEKVIFNINDVKQVSQDETIFALGKFRSIHKGHQKILLETKKWAEKEGKKFGFMIFDDKDSVLSLEVRLELLSQYNPDYILLFEENAINYRVNQRQFMKYMKDVFNTTGMVVGKSFNFGKGNLDDHEIMREFVELKVIDYVKYEDKVISTSLIKLVLEEGAVYPASLLLGFNYIYKGVVETGEQRGRDLGFPTANVKFPDKVFRPMEGIYASYITVRGNRYASVTSISSNPTFEDGAVKYETYIFDFNEIIYGDEVYVELVDFIRRPTKFETTEKLIKQIEDDVYKAQNILKNREY